MSLQGQMLRGSDFIPILEYYQAFAAALPHHTFVLNHLDATQKQIVDARVALQEAKDALGTKRSDLMQLSVRGQTIEEMLRLLDEMCVFCRASNFLFVPILEQRALEDCSGVPGIAHVRKEAIASCWTPRQEFENKQETRDARDRRGL